MKYINLFKEKDIRYSIIKKKDDTMPEKKENTFVSIVAVTLGIFMIITVLFLILAPSQLGLLIPLSWAFVVLGLVVAIVSAKSARKK